MFVVIECHTLYCAVS